MSDNPIVLMKTSLGDLKIELDAVNAPVSCENFLTYVNDGFYDGTIFHRVINGFMLQGGGFTPDMVQKETHAPIKNEADNGLKNTHGSLAMARTQVVDSATSQFFINVADNAFLDHTDTSDQGFGYAVFGNVIEGSETVDTIRSIATGTSGHYQDVPVEPVIIESVKVAD